MVQIEPFSVEQWFDKYASVAKHNIADTCSASVSIDQLRQFSTDLSDSPILDFSRKLNYGAVPGSVDLRNNISNLYKTQADAPVPADNILVTQGGIAANFLLLYTLIGPGDHVICVYPTYQQLYEVPKALGAEVSLWKLAEENEFVLNFLTLEELTKLNTKLIIVNNPNNPTGSSTPREVLERIIAFAESRGIYVLADEVYRPLYHSLPDDFEIPPSIIELGYNKTIATSSMSKTYSLAGIRLGWIATPDSALVSKLLAARDYTTITVSQLDDQVATYALSPAVLPNLLKRNLSLAKTNLTILAAFIDEHKSICRWVKPTAGTIAIVEIKHNGVPVDDEYFCKKLLDEKSLLLVPASSCFGNKIDFKGHVRFGYVCETGALQESLQLLREHLKKPSSFLKQLQ